MKCRHCGAKIPTDSEICFRCGKVPAKKKVKVGAVALAVASGLVALGVIVTALLWAVGVLRPGDNNVYCRSNYTVWDLFLGDRMDDVVASVGDAHLTNAQLNVFYWMHIYNYAQYYKADFSKPLNQQVMDEETGMTWQQYFIECAVSSWKQYQLVAQLAEKAGFKLPKEYESNITSLVAQAKSKARENGFKSVDEMLEADFGKGVTLGDYREFFYLYYISNAYYEEYTAKLEATEAEMNAYYEEHKDELKTYWNVAVTKDIGRVADVRHILYIPSGGKVENGVQVFSDEAWANCLKDIQAIYDEWLAGHADEESFAQLAYETSDDSNSQDGGLYVDISKDVMVDEFEEWCLDENRKYGDHTLVKTAYGYHIIFFVSGEDGWERYCREGALVEKGKDFVEKLMTENDAHMDYTKLVLANIDLNSK